MMRSAGLILVLSGLAAGNAAAQSSSLWRVPATEQQGSVGANGSVTMTSGSFSALPPKDEETASTRAIEAVSLISVPRIPQRKFKVHDLITVIVKQQKDYQSKAKLDTERKWDFSGKLTEWLRLYPENRLGKAELSKGPPSVTFKYDDKRQDDGKNQRGDKFETRFQARIVDVKPNGNLVIEAKQSETHDEEVIEITLTGVCRSEDVTPANTIFSTQIAEMVLVEKNSGALRDATTRGWIPRLLDWTKPF
jgi:flagellar L-ring protein FlgH